ncbi:c-type cytochrome [Planctomicrobium sp. SH661]|uniref:c-type cytochrome n=1 Tax=Planctomicrobium sp. SH661 TaxID=3448124 RepID=UPI003F5C5640
MPATDEYWRSLPRVHKIFAFSAIVLLGTTLLMMYKDESRSWRVYQAEAENLRVQKIDKALAKLDDGDQQAQVAAAEKKVLEAQALIDARKAEIAELERRLSELEGQKQIFARDSKAANAYRDKARADYDIAVRDQVAPEKLAIFHETYKSKEEEAKEKALESEQKVTEFNAVKSELTALRADMDNANAELARAQADRNALEEQKELLRPQSAFAAWKRKFKELPIINGFNPHLKIQYDWAADLKQTLGMTRVSRVDRCRTCHVNISDFGAGNVANYPAGEYAEPFCSHPNPDLYLTATSPHPVNNFGCTICHDGDGSGTAFQSAEHTANNPAVAAKWEEEHHWHKNHFWEYPMFPKQFIESSCLKCHPKVVELGVNDKFGESAPKLFKGYSLIRDYGCFGCHEINGYDGTSPIGPDMRLEPQTPEEFAKYAEDPNQIAGLMRKVGPSLRHIKEKVTPEFIAYWTAEPKRFRPSTRMPQFFGLSNQHDDMAKLLQPIELAAISKFLIAKSEPIELTAPTEGYEPNAERGLDLFSKRGCLACHSKSGEEFKDIHADFGPDLSRIAEKLLPGEAGFNWLYSWVKEPTLYHRRTKMPDLFLDPYQEGDVTIDPAADIAAYLLQGPRATEFPALAESKPYLGVTLDPNYTEAKALKLGIRKADFGGVLVSDTMPGSPTDRAESKSGENWITNPIEPGDQITAVNGQAISSPEQFQEILNQSKTGDVVQLAVVRNGQKMTFQMQVSTPLDDLVRLYLSKNLTKTRMENVFNDRRYPVSPDMYADGKSPADFIKGDEIELVPTSLDEQVTPEEWERRKMLYIGRRTVSRYGCYGCHDIPDFESARPIGTALQDWGRKDTSKLAFEHIHEFLHHHGEPDGGSTAARLERAVKNAEAGNKGVSEQELDEAYLYESVISHGRAGFLWQKLREPRSYDYMKTETKGWDERLRMPKFPFNSEDIEAVSTFVLGLVADPPSPQYMYMPDGAAGAKIEGERLIEKYNCAGCHMLEIPVWEFGIEPDDLVAPPLAEGEQRLFDLFKKMKPPENGLTGHKLASGEPIMRATGYPQQFPDPEDDPEDQLYSFVLWDAVNIGDDKTLMPGQPIPVVASQIQSQGHGRGGDLAKWLIPRLPGKERGVKDINEAWQAAPPPLYKEGDKVQTPWLYQFLKNPEQLRFTTVLRMPKFNMSDEEAQALANYFAAVDGAAYPYQLIPERQPEYQREAQAEYLKEFPHSEPKNYLDASWLVLNGPLCRKCHSVGGNIVTETDPSQVKRGPNLQRVERRLRPDYAKIWIHNPKWILPYTSMPQNFPPGGKSAMAELFDGENSRQEAATVDALFNYTHLIETVGPTTYNPPETPAEGAPAEGTPETEPPAEAGAAPNSTTSTQPDPAPVAQGGAS